MSRAAIAACVLAAAVLMRAPAAFAQAADPPASRFEVAIGGIWIGAQPLGDQTVTETTAAGVAQMVFKTSSELARAAGFSARVGVRLTRRLVAEAEASYTQPQLRIAATADTEGAAAVTAVETVQQFTIGGGVRWYVPVGTRRVAPFATAGGGYLRQLHEAATLVETGRYYDFGGGVDVLLVASRHVHTKGAGIRVDARAVIRSRGVAFDGGSKTSPAAGVSAFVRF